MSALLPRGHVGLAIDILHQEFRERVVCDLGDDDARLLLRSVALQVDRSHPDAPVGLCLSCLSPYLGLFDESAPPPSRLAAALPKTVRSSALRAHLADLHLHVARAARRMQAQLRLDRRARRCQRESACIAGVVLLLLLLGIRMGSRATAAHLTRAARAAVHAAEVR